MSAEDRRTAVRDQMNVNGIDFLEVDPAQPTLLVVHFIHNLPSSATAPVPNVPADELVATDFAISGGERITTINVVNATATAQDEMTVEVDREGDFSIYTLTLRNASGATPPGFDPHTASVQFLFHVECAKRFDCKPALQCPPTFTAPPEIDYLAKDYPGFVRVMLDRMALLVPGWAERNPADLGVALVEMLAYVGDHLSYRQDAIATEAYLGTARLRTSARRHARLVDYRISDGSNARAWLRVTVNADVPGGIPRATRFATAFPSAAAPLLARAVLPYREAVSAGATFFEAVGDSPPLFHAHDEMPLYNWSETVSCLAPGATHATLAGTFPSLARGMVLILAEKVGPLTGNAADADPAKRVAVRLIRDATTSTDLVTGAAVTEIDWHPEDALTFPVCIASRTDAEHGEQAITGVSVAWGNVVLADHGRSIGVPSDPLVNVPEAIGTVALRASTRFRPRLAGAPLTFAASDPFANDHPASLLPIKSARAATIWRVTDTSPAVAARSVDPDGNALQWKAVGDLLDIGVGQMTTAFVAEVETDGTAYLRFGDGTNGLVPPLGAHFTATYRVGNGSAGNVARDALVLIDTADLPAAAKNAIVAVTNPLPAWGGTDPEAVDHVRQSAPVAFRTQLRAVTADDYRDVALKYPGVRRAAATFRWTGSWLTVFLTVEREAGAELDQAFIAGLEAFVDGYRMAGYDLEVEDAQRVPLLIAMHVCVRDGYVASDVARAVSAVFSNQVLPDGTLGMFHHDRLDLGAPFYLSPLYAAAQAIDGVASVRITRFERQEQPSDDALSTGVLIPDRLELFVLANDASFPERGQFELTVDGGL